MVASRKKNLKSRSARKSQRGKRTTPRRIKRTTTPRRSRGTRWSGHILSAGEFNELASLGGTYGVVLQAMENVGTGKSIQEQVLDPVKFGTKLYGVASGFHDIVRGARALKNLFLLRLFA